MEADNMIDIELINANRYFIIDRCYDQYFGANIFDNTSFYLRPTSVLTQTQKIKKNT